MLRLLLSTLILCGLGLAFTGCGLPIPGHGAGGGAWKPDSVMNNAYMGDLAGAKEGQSVTYVTEASGNKTSMKTSIVGTKGDSTLVEVWMDAGSMAYGTLYLVDANKVITKAWAAAKDDKEWTSITVNEPPKVDAQPADGPKPVIKESDESKQVAAGSFASRKIETTVNVNGTDYSSTAWFAKDVPGIATPSPHGGMVAMEASGSVTSLESVATDAKPTIPLPTIE